MTGPEAEQIRLPKEMGEEPGKHPAAAFRVKQSALLQRKRISVRHEPR